MEYLPYHLVQDFFHQQWLLSILAKYLEPVSISCKFRCRKGLQIGGLYIYLRWGFSCLHMYNKLAYNNSLCLCLCSNINKYDIQTTWFGPQLVCQFVRNLGVPIQSPHFFTGLILSISVEIGRPQVCNSSGEAFNNSIWEMFLQISVSYYSFDITVSYC